MCNRASAIDAPVRQLLALIERERMRLFYATIPAHCGYARGHSDF
jgi:hypothetical protein